MTDQFDPEWQVDDTWTAMSGDGTKIIFAQHDPARKLIKIVRDDGVHARISDDDMHLMTEAAEKACPHCGIQKVWIDFGLLPNVGVSCINCSKSFVLKKGKFIATDESGSPVN